VKKMTSSVAVCLAVLLTVVSVLTNSIAFANENDAVTINPEQDILGIPQSDNDMNQPENAFIENLESLNALNTVAIDADVVFIFIPGMESSIADDATNASALAAQQSLSNNNIISRLYILPSNSSDYLIISEQVQTPAVLVAIKGGGIAVVPCDKISEEMLLQAFLSCCDSGSGCCP